MRRHRTTTRDAQATNTKALAIQLGRLTIRIRSKVTGQIAGSWGFSLENTRMLAYAKGTLAHMQKEEPDNQWILQTQGTQTTWHDWRE